MKKKIKVEIAGMMFELPIKFLKRTDYYGKPLKNPKINMNEVATASVLKQYVKKKYPNVVVSSTSSSFANGCSTDVYLSDTKGNPIDKEIIYDVKSFGARFVYGYFNGMEDMYEMKSGDNISDNGTELDAGCKYLSVNNYPKFCSLPDIVKMLINMTTTEQYVYGKITIEKAIQNVKDYGATENNITKALQLI
jgi:hypothetical protein